MVEKAKVERVKGNETTEQDKLVIYLRKIFGTSPSKTDKNTLAGEGISETVLLDWLADIPVLARVKAKRKKGKSLSGGEWCLLVGHKIGNGFGHGFKLLLKLFKPFIKFGHWVWKMVIEALKELGIYKYAKAIFTLVVVAIAIWFTWEAFHYGVMRPVEMIWSKIHHQSVVTEESPTPVPTPQPEVSTLMSLANSAMTHLKPKPTSIPTPTVIYQPSVLFTNTVYDPKLLEQEIAAVPANSVIKAYPLQPDETMPGDLAASRLQDLTNSDKYTMKLGSGTEKVLSVMPSATNFTLNYKSTDVISIFGGSQGQLNFFWEDVKYIHSDEIDVETKVPSVMYQCSLIVSDSKDALTIQCATADDLKHLVSTMEYFIRNSRLGHDAQPGSMPYSNQGLQLNGDCVVEKLWANSPVDQAGVQLGDMLWSLEKDQFYPPDRKKLEAGLDAMQPGPHTLFIASNADFTKAESDSSFGRASSLNPKRRAVSLNLPHFYENDVER
jgi:hypothetical protein